MSYIEPDELMMYTSLFQLENVQGDFEFENAESTEYET